MCFSVLKKDSHSSFLPTEASLLVALAAVWPPQHLLNNSAAVQEYSSPDRVLGRRTHFQLWLPFLLTYTQGSVRPSGSSPHLQKAGHGADVVGTCSLPHVVHPLSSLQHNTPSMTHQSLPPPCPLKQLPSLGTQWHPCVPEKTKLGL